MDVGNLDGPNSGFYSRAFFTKESKPFDLEGPVLEDVCRLNRFVLNGVDVNLKLYRQSPSFCLLALIRIPIIKSYSMTSFSERVEYRCRPASSWGITKL